MNYELCFTKNVYFTIVYIYIWQHLGVFHTQLLTVYPDMPNLYKKNNYNTCIYI